MSTALAMDSESGVLTVAQLTEVIKVRLESDRRLMQCAVVGELSNFKHHSSGHMYFTLKDDKSRIRGIMFARRNRGLPFVPKDGMRVICTGSVGVFERDGQYQLYVDEMQPDGVGALYVAYLQLRDKLAQEGLFDSDHKRSLPAFPRRIGVVTSATGAVIRDICTTLARRYPLASVVLAPAAVQGPGAADTIVHALDQLRRLHDGGHAVDIVIVGRGGGSLEELWPFNEEVVARAIYSYPIPVISAVGHETDTTICDFVADLRAATPTAAAELAVPHVQDLQTQLTNRTQRAGQALYYVLSKQRQRLKTVQSGPILRDPMRLLDRRKQTLDYVEARLDRRIQTPLQVATRQVTGLSERLYRVDLSRRMVQAVARIGVDEQRLRAAVHRRLEHHNQTLEQRIASLQALNPLGVLSRGYSVVFDAAGERVISRRSGLAPGERIRIQMSDGQIGARIESEQEADDERGKQLRLDI